MNLQDRLEISDVLARHGFLADAHDYDRMNTVFCTDVMFDRADGPSQTGLESLVAYWKSRDVPVAHYLTNTIVEEREDGAVSATSKGLSIGADRSIRASEYRDLLVKTPDGWRIQRRSVSTLGRIGPSGG